jgi:hypothetical protein
MAEKREAKKGRTIAAPQDLHDVVKAALLEAQFLVGTLETPQTGDQTREADCASNSKDVATAHATGRNAPPQSGQGVMNSHNGTKRPPNIVLLHVQLVKYGIA